jgi:formylglycine-generating enzyme required for sulfatase activity
MFLLLPIKMKKWPLFLALICCCPFISIGQPEMILVEGGSFFMGDTVRDADEKPIHRVTLSSFYMAKTETTVAQFKTFADATGYLTDAESGEGSYVWDSLGWHKREGVNWRHGERGQLLPASDYNRAVTHVTWGDAAHYCNWLSEQAGLKKVYDFQKDTLKIDLSANGYRLPTEAEWEYAARGELLSPLEGGKGGEKALYAGEGNISGLGWYSGNANRHVHPVGLKKPNALGIFDLTGNVWEWCHDWYDKNYYTKTRNAENPPGPTSGEYRSLRGGSWNNSGKHCRVASRSSRYPDFRDGSVGFRVVRQ